MPSRGLYSSFNRVAKSVQLPLLRQLPLLPMRTTLQLSQLLSSRAFFSFSPCNHIINIKQKILFPAKQKKAQFLPFIFCFIRELKIFFPAKQKKAQFLPCSFCFIRELNLYSPPYLLPHLRARTQTYTPPLPSPSPHPSALKPEAL